jgi:hypothetical protein
MAATTAAAGRTRRSTTERHCSRVHAMRTPNRWTLLVSSVVFAGLVACACPPAAKEPAPPAEPAEPAEMAEPVEPAEPAEPAPEGDGAAERELPLPGQGMPCTGDGRCAEGLACLSYYGVAGPQGPKFSSCELSCMNRPDVCPEGQRCIVIADGPGQVCRPAPIPASEDDAEPAPL